jgi:hypothetical protein
MAVLAVGVASGDRPPLTVVTDPQVSGSGIPPNALWFDNLDPESAGWTHGDYTAPPVLRFQVSQYHAYDDGTPPPHNSWWCGTFDYDTDGGYGNHWDDRLDVPPTDWSGAVYPMISFAYRSDTEEGFDFTYVQAKALGVYVNLNSGYSGVIPWSTSEFDLSDKDNPAICRFRFVSDCGWSDQDGLYQSDGGAFHCDNIRIWDFFTGDDDLFYDNVESGGLCTPSVPAPAGDYWHIGTSLCKSFSGAGYWANTEPDTPGFVPPSVQNWLRTPMVGVSSTVTCTVSFVFQYFTPTVDCDYWTETVHLDGVGTQLHALWGDQCDDGYPTCAHFLASTDITALLPASQAQYEWTYYSTDNGAGPDVCQCAGITLDNVGFHGTQLSAAEKTSWSTVKALYR